MNVAYPDTEAVYWTTPFIPDPSVKITVSGTYPTARYFSITTYDSTFGYFTNPAGITSGIADYLIEPEQIGTNPWITSGAPVGAPWQVNITTSGVGVNTIPMVADAAAIPAQLASSQPFSFIIMRVYVPAGTSPATAWANIALPSITFSRVAGATSTASTSTASTITPCDTPALAKAVALSKDAAKAKRVLETIKNGPTAYVEPCASGTTNNCVPDLQFILPSPCVTNSVFPNPDNAYIAATYQPKKGYVVVATAKAPTSPSDIGTGTRQHNVGAIPMPWNTTGGPAGYQVRYWSIANSLYQAPFPIVTRVTKAGTIYSGMADLQATLKNANFVVVASKVKPRTTRATAGVTWLPTKASKSKVTEILMMRNMLSNTTFTQSIQQIAASFKAAGGTVACPFVPSQAPADSPYANPAQAKAVMGAYYPSVYQCKRSTFEAAGVAGCARESKASTP